MNRKMIAIFTVALTCSPALAAKKSMAEKLIAGPPDIIFHTSKSVDDVQACLASGMSSFSRTTVQTPSGPRLILQGGMAVIDLEKEENGTKVTQRAFRLDRAAVMHWVRGCASTN